MNYVRINSNVWEYDISPSPGNAHRFFDNWNFSAFSRQQWTRTATCCHTTWCKLAFLRLFLSSYHLASRWDLADPFQSVILLITCLRLQYVLVYPASQDTKIFLFQWNFVYFVHRERAEEIDLPNSF